MSTRMQHDDKWTGLVEASDAISHIDQRGQLHYTKEFRQELAERSGRGESVTRIFADHGLTVDLLGWKRMERAAAHARAAHDTPLTGEAVKYTRTYTDRDREQWCREYLDGWSYRQISAKHGCSRRSLYLTFRNAGIIKHPHR